MGGARLIQVLKNEGILAFMHLTCNKIGQNMSEGMKYKRWMKKWEANMHRQQDNDILKLRYKPRFTVIILGEDKGTLQSVLKQTYHADDIIQVAGYSRPSNSDVKWVSTLQDAIDRSRGEYIGFVYPEDRLHPQCLFWFARYLQKKEARVEGVLYSDEDEITGSGKRRRPFFKPDYAPDTLRSFYYIGGFFCVKKTKIPADFQWDMQREWWDYELMLKMIGIPGNIKAGHIKKVLYHRKKSLRRSITALERMKQTWLEQNHISAHTEPIEECRAVRLVYDLPKEKPFISFIIPSKDNPSLLEACLRSIKQYTRYPNYEVIVVDNGGTPDNKREYEAILNKCGISFRYHYEKMEFNYSKMCNLGADMAQGELLLFLNDDIELMEETCQDWLERMAGHALQEYTGAVGAKLYYPNSTRIQHIGLINYKSGIAHTLSGMDDDKVWNNGRNRMEYNYVAVTGAALMIRKELFWQVEGFCEDLPVTFNDVELCYRLSRIGYYSVVRNDVVLYHGESITRGEDRADDSKLLRSLKERQKLFAMHPNMVYRDPFYSPNLTQIRLDNGINSAQNHKISPAVKKDEFGASTGEEIIWEIQAVLEEDAYRIEGYAFFKEERYNNLNRIYLVLEDDNDKRHYYKVNKTYDATLAKALQMDKKIYLSAFTVLLDEMDLIGKYRIGIYLKNPLSGRQAEAIGNKIIIKQ